MSNESHRSSPELQLLGRSENQLPTEPDSEILECFPNRNPERDFSVQLDCSDFSSLCPVTGQPDAARIVIRYVPGDQCVETKSLKFYLASYRTTAAFNEEIVNRILADLIKAASPKAAVIRGEFAARGGISLTAEVCHPAVADAKSLLS